MGGKSISIYTFYYAVLMSFQIQDVPGQDEVAITRTFGSETLVWTSLNFSVF